MSGEVATSFSNDGEDVIHRELSAQGDPLQNPATPTTPVPAETSANTEDTLLAAFFEIDRCVNALDQPHLKKIALQFPDDLLSHAVQVMGLLQAKLPGKKFFLLADTTYGSCCVDEVAASHVQADVVVHYGNSCLSRTSRVPALYVFGKYPVDIQKLCSDIDAIVEEVKGNGTQSEDRVHVVFDVRFQHAADALRSGTSHLPSLNIVNLEESFSSAQILPPVTDPETGTSPAMPLDDHDAKRSFRFGRDLEGLTCLSADGHTFVFVGELQSRLLTNLMMYFSRSKFKVFSPSRSRVYDGPATIGRQLSRRYFLVQKAKDAQTVGLLLGTLGTAHYGKMVQMLVSMIRASGKKVYTLIMGKINPAKLANFTEMDVYCLVSCPHNALVDSTEFFRPVLTPFEIQLACAPGKEWDGHFESEYAQLMGSLHKDLRDMMHNNEDEDPSESAEPHFSLITNSYIEHRTKHRELVESSDGTIMLRNNNNELAQYGAGHLQTRTFQGLEQKLGETPVVKAVQGRTGIAVGYEEEPATADKPANLSHRNQQQNVPSRPQLSPSSTSVSMQTETQPFETKDVGDVVQDDDDDDDDYLEEDFGNLSSLYA